MVFPPATPLGVHVGVAHNLTILRLWPKMTNHFQRLEVAGRCVLHGFSPWSPPFAPATPRGDFSAIGEVRLLGSVHLSAAAPHLPDAGRQRQRRCGQTRDLPGPMRFLLRGMSFDPVGSSPDFSGLGPFSAR
jgi:hypothetical protein